jgi:hypothetical protein
MLVVLAWSTPCPCSASGSTAGPSCRGHDSVACTERALRTFLTEMGPIILRDREDRQRRRWARSWVANGDGLTSQMLWAGHLFFA